MRYFGYGSNLDLEDLRRYCARRDLALGRFEAVGPAWLPDHALAFHYYSHGRGGGALDVVPARGSAVPGVLFEVDEGARRVLDLKEGAGSRYEVREVTVLREDGSAERAFTYMVLPEFREGRHVEPTTEYVSIVRRGLEAHGMPSEPLDDAAANRRPRPLPDEIFVYGTLKRGHCRAHLLGETLAEEAEIAGELVDLGAYPGLRLAGPGVQPGVVHGELHRTRLLHEGGDLAELLQHLDEVEDFLGWDLLDGSMYHRALVRARAASGTRLAWTYVYRGTEPRPVIEDGVWRGE
ncbi:MAG: hypothetical protein CMN30_00055 [Sandaracinus sp.]|nr:hypothetical protein [Sandaracinus sp.]